MRRVLALLGFVLVGLSFIPLAAAFPKPASPVEANWQNWFMQVFWAALVVGVIVEGLLLYALIRFRARKKGPQEGPQIHGNTKMEIAWTIAPAIVMGWLLILSFKGLFITDDHPEYPEDFVVKVTGSQFVWTFEYPDGSTGTTDLYVEQNRVVGLEIHSTDVIHAFSIHGLGVMMDAVPGRTNHFWFKATEAGDYPIRCRELCGVGHSRMLGTTHVFAEGSQDKPYGKAEELAAVSESPTPTPTSTQNNTTTPTGAQNNTTTMPPGTQNGTQNSSAPVQGREVPVVLGPGGKFTIDPATLTADVAEALTFTVRNDHKGVPHNFYIGTRDTSKPNDGANWTTDTLQTGQTAEVLFSFDKDQTFDFWCDVPGHYDLGMKGTLTVGKGGGAGAGKTPILPSLESLGLVAALAGAVLLVRRRP